MLTLEQEMELVKRHVFFFKRKYSINIKTDELINIGYIGLLKAKKAYKKDKSAFTTYAFYRIRGEIFDYMRKNNKHDNLEEINPKKIDSKVDVEKTVSSRQVEKILNKLNPEEREIIYSYFFEEKSLKEIGKQKGLSKSWVSRLLAKTLNKSAKILAPEYT